MNNEEKILSILEKMNGNLESVKSDVSDLKSDVADLKSDVADLKTRVTKIEITQENIVLPRLSLLAEGQSVITAQLLPKSRVEQLEDEVALLKTVVKMNTQQISELKSAM